MTSQHSGSMFEGMTKTVAIPIASPNRESSPISFQFMVSPLPFLPRRTCFYFVSIALVRRLEESAAHSKSRLVIFSQSTRGLDPPRLGDTPCRQDARLRGTKLAAGSEYKDAATIPRAGWSVFC